MDLDAAMRARLLGNSEVARGIGVTPTAVGYWRSRRTRPSPANERALVVFLNRYPVLTLEDPDRPKPAPAPIEEPRLAPLRDFTGPNRRR